MLDSCLTAAILSIQFAAVEVLPERQQHRLGVAVVEAHLVQLDQETLLPVARDPG